MDTLRTWLKQLEHEVEEYSKKHKVHLDSIRKSKYYPSNLTTTQQNTACLCIGIAIGTVFPRLILRPYARYATVDDIPTSWIRKKATLNAKVVKVTDGDTFRAVHWPPFRRPASINGGKKLSESTLQIRLAGIDTPETAKFGKSGQPFGEEAKATLTRLLSDSKLKLQLLSKDQYGRVVCSVWTGGKWYWPFRTNISEEMVRLGLATVYRQSGATYGEDQEAQLATFEALEASAKKSKLKIWKNKNNLSPAQYKAS